MVISLSQWMKNLLRISNKWHTESYTLCKPCLTFTVGCSGTTGNLGSSEDWFRRTIVCWVTIHTLNTGSAVISFTVYTSSNVSILSTTVDTFKTKDLLEQLELLP